MRTKTGRLFMGFKKTIYDGKALTEEQINLLKERGLIISDPYDSAKSLFHIGFYRLFSYAKPLLDKKILKPPLIK